MFLNKVDCVYIFELYANFSAKSLNSAKPDPPPPTPPPPPKKGVCWLWRTYLRITPLAAAAAASSSVGQNQGVLTRGTEECNQRARVWSLVGLGATNAENQKSGKLNSVAASKYWEQNHTKKNKSQDQLKGERQDMSVVKELAIPDFVSCHVFHFDTGLLQKPIFGRLISQLNKSSHWSYTLLIVSHATVVVSNVSALDFRCYSRRCFQERVEGSEWCLHTCPGNIPSQFYFCCW